MNKYLLTFAVSVFSVGFLSACSSEPESYTVDFLSENEEVRSTVLEDCKANKQSDENCKNANEAEAKSQVKSLEDRMNQ